MAIETWDCSHMSLTDLPREVLEHRATLRQLNLSSNAIRDVPRVSKIRVVAELTNGC